MHFANCTVTIESPINNAGGHSFIFKNGLLTNPVKMKVAWASGHTNLLITDIDSGRQRREYSGRWSELAYQLYRQIVNGAWGLWRYQGGDTGKYLEWSRKHLAANPARFRPEFQRALDERINLKVAPPLPWRKLRETYQIELMRDKLMLDQRGAGRIPLSEIRTPELRQRLAHRLYIPE